MTVASLPALSGVAVATTTREQELEADLATLTAKYDSLYSALTSAHTTALETAGRLIDAEQRAAEAERQREAWRDYAFGLEAERNALQILADEGEGWRADWYAISRELRQTQRRQLAAGCLPSSDTRPTAYPSTASLARGTYVEPSRPPTRPYRALTLSPELAP